MEDFLVFTCVLKIGPYSDGNEEIRLLPSENHGSYISIFLFAYKQHDATIGHPLSFSNCLHIQLINRRILILEIKFRQFRLCTTIKGGSRRAENSRKVLMMMKAAKLGWAGAGAGKEQGQEVQKLGRAGAGKKQGWSRIRAEVETGQVQGSSR